MVVTLGQQYDIGGSPPLYCTLTLIAMQEHQINSEDKTVHHQTIKTNPIQSLKREQRNMMMRIFIIQVHDPVIHLEVDEEQ